MQDKYCGNCCDIYLIQSQYKGNHKEVTRLKAPPPTSFLMAAKGRQICILALNNVDIVADTTIVALHVCNGPKMHFQGRETTRLGIGVFVIPQSI